VDAAGSEYLVELAIEFAQTDLVPHGVLVAKVFHGASYDTLVKLFKASFQAVKPFKPKASRDRSCRNLPGRQRVAIAPRVRLPCPCRGYGCDVENIPASGLKGLKWSSPVRLGVLASVFVSITWSFA